MILALHRSPSCDPGITPAWREEPYEVRAYRRAQVLRAAKAEGKAVLHGWIEGEPGVPDAIVKAFAEMASR